MAYDDELADRVRAVLCDEPAVTEKRMFGGQAFLVDGSMAVAANSQGALMVRVDPELSESLIGEAHVARVEMRGREMAGWLNVNASALVADESLRRWVAIGVSRAVSLTHS